MKKVLKLALGAALVLGLGACNSDDDSPNPTPGVAAMGGELIYTGADISFMIGDRVPDNIADGTITVEGNSGETTKWVITNTESEILGIQDADDLDQVDFDGAGEGTCLVWAVTYNGEITGLEVGQSANDLKGDFELTSNNVEVKRVEGENFTSAATIEGGPFTIIVDNIADNLMEDAIEVTDEGAGATSSWIITDDSGETILGLPKTSFAEVNFDVAGPGTCKIWYATLAPNVTGVTVDAKVADIQGSYRLSNSIDVRRVAKDDATLVDLALATPSLSLLVEAVTRPSFGDAYTAALTGDNDLTVLAPNNDAFAALLDLDATPDTLAEVGDDQLKTILDLHVIDGEIKSTDLMNGDVTTLGGGIITVNVDNDITFTGPGGSVSTVIEGGADIEAKNGVVHIIDMVILPQL